MALQVSLTVQGSPPVLTENGTAAFLYWEHPVRRKYVGHHANYLRLKGINYLVVIDLTVF